LDRNKGEEFCADHSITIYSSAPDNINVTIVDLPGFHNSNDVDTEKVQEMNKKYIQMEGTLLLHVCKGDQDYNSILGNGEYDVRN
jgi:hypothetical protein